MKPISAAESPAVTPVVGLVTGAAELVELAELDEPVELEIAVPEELAADDAEEI